MGRQKKKEERFEDQLEQLESIVGRLEDESVGLEEALELFEHGMGLARACRKRLEEIELRIDRLLEENEEGEAQTEALELE
jgi:exodeoxyribonuclease VII small subunit